jgi:hypothetical protein
MTMARKQPVEDRDVLTLKLGVLQDYLSYRERKLRQFQIDLQKSAVLQDARDVDGFVDRVLNTVLELYNADPPTSLIETDLADARAEVNAALMADGGWDEIKRQMVESGLAGAPTEAGFDAVLTHAAVSMIARLTELRTRAASAEGYGGLVRELLGAMESARNVFEAALDPARRLRQRWIDALNGRAAAGSTRAGRRGRPKDKAVAVRNRKMYEAWKTQEYSTYATLGKEFGVTADVARKAVTSLHRKQERKSRDAT